MSPSEVFVDFSRMLEIQVSHHLLLVFGFETYQGGGFFAILLTVLSIENDQLLLTEDKNTFLLL